MSLLSSIVTHTVSIHTCILKQHVRTCILHLGTVPSLHFSSGDRGSEVDQSPLVGEHDPPYLAGWLASCIATILAWVVQWYM